MNFIKTNAWALKARWKNAIHIFFIWYGSIWLAVESLGAFDKDRFAFLQTPKILSVTLLICLIATLVTNRFRSAVIFKLPHTNSTVQIKFGDYFEEPGVKGIPVNEFFDGILGSHVSNGSIHGQFIHKYFGGNSTAFSAALAPALSNSPSIPINRANGNFQKYEIGTVANIAVNSDIYMLFALCHTDINTLKAITDLPTYMNAMGKFWDAARVTCNGRPVIVPLIGTGLAGIGLPAPQMLELLLLTFVEANKRSEVCQRLIVVLYPPRYSEFNLLNVQEIWEA